MIVTRRRSARADERHETSRAGAPRRTLRLSLTPACDLRCRYCNPTGPRATVAATGSELTAAALWLVERFAVERIRLTGGEPLLAADLVATVERLANHPGVREVAMTTNGMRLAAAADSLHRAGLARVNVSLDTLDPVRFAALTGGGDVSRVTSGIAAAIAAGLAPVKLNAVLRRSSWRDDVPALLDFAAERGLEVRFIELMRTGPDPRWCAAEQLSADTVRDWLASVATVTCGASASPAPARPTTVGWRGSRVRVGWITPVSNPFCAGCTRLRLDSQGNLRRCLMDGETLPLTGLLAREEAERTTAAVAAYLAAKRAPAAMHAPEVMVAIGG